MNRHAAAILMASFCCAPAGASTPAAAPAPAPVEARAPFAPAVFLGSDGLRHLAYELHVSNFYGDTGPLAAAQLQVWPDNAGTPLLRLDGTALAAAFRPSPAEGHPPPIAAGKRGIVFVWLTLPAAAPLPHTLRQQLAFTDEHGAPLQLDGATVAVDARPVPVIGAPLRGGIWLAHEGPGNVQSHHWGSLVAVNGELTIPQRYALDLAGVDAHGRALRRGVTDLQHTRHADWIGHGWEVIAVADGIVQATRDGDPEHAPLVAQPEPSALTADVLFGNHVVLEIAPGVFASYAHLQPGSVQVKPGNHVTRGQRLARLGQSGNSAAPTCTSSCRTGPRSKVPKACRMCSTASTCWARKARRSCSRPGRPGCRHRRSRGRHSCR
ncbi:MAG: hypothetical protein GAK31_00306 [Stenotrophomonas maltophilia]|uniref:M23ase beta-sheet core domain-containing protein n=1 Tax=Stenotrophomonas maltophilia TaxID=40324 RepID=A0A7V8FJB5_STEMA|nr:MAG: hypothetical protein GAK31_00306 [Stenotrophomonas maltophilia]